MLADKDVYNTPRCAYLLEKLENHFHPKETVRAAGYTIEHVMPQTLSEEWKVHLGENADDIHSRLLHTLGNLTLTGYNSELSCRAFKEKLDLAEGGFLSSPRLLNRKIREQTTWCEEQIISRGAELAEVVLKVWAEPDSSALTEFAEPEKLDVDAYDLDHYPQLSGAMRSLYDQLEERLLALHPAARREEAGTRSNWRRISSTSFPRHRNSSSCLTCGLTKWMIRRDGTAILLTWVGGGTAM